MQEYVLLPFQLIRRRTKEAAFPQRRILYLRSLTGFKYKYGPCSHLYEWSLYQSWFENAD